MGNLINKHGILTVFYILALFDVCLGTPFIIRICLLLLLVILSFSDDFVFSLPVIILLNDSLGTAFGNSISFYWIAAALIVLRFIYMKHYVLLQTTSLFLVIGAAYCCYSFFFQYEMSFRSPLLLFCYFVLVAFIIEYAIRNDVPTNRIFLAFGCACLIAAIQMVFFGGIVYTTSSYNDANSWVQVTRYGLVGLGVGDPNFSGLRLLFGMICILFSDINKYLKTICIGLLSFCIVKTVSMSAFIAFGLIIALIVVTTRSGRKTKIVCGIVIAVLVALFIFTVFPPESLSEQISYFEYRIQSIFSLLLEGDYGTATTGRTLLAKKTLNYAFDRNIFNVFFGFDNSSSAGVVPHNTYIELLISFGIVGLIIIIDFVIRNYIMTILSYFENRDSESRFLVILKSLYLAYCFTLSINSGPDVVLLIWFVLIL